MMKNIYVKNLFCFFVFNSLNIIQCTMNESFSQELQNKEMKTTTPPYIDNLTNIDIPFNDKDILKMHTFISEHVIKQANIPISYQMKPPVTPFVGRLAEISEIKWAHSDRNMAVIIGPQGVGKTELARKYAQEFKHDNTSCTLWMDSESHGSLITAFKDLAVLLGITVEKKQITTLIREVISHFNNRKSLFIFDNSADDNILVKNLPSFIGNSRFIYVIITSRDDNWQHKKFKVTQLDVFSVDEAKEYLKLTLGKIYNFTCTDSEVEELSQLLGRLPLALREAVLYINQQNLLHAKTVYSINDYINQFRTKFSIIQESTTEGLSDIDLERAVARKLLYEAKRLANRIYENGTTWSEMFALKAKTYSRQFRRFLGFEVKDKPFKNATRFS